MTTDSPGRKVKVCLVTHSYPRFEGDWRSNFIESLADAYAAEGAEVTVFVPYTVGWKRDQVGPVRIITYRYAPVANWHVLGYGASLRSDLRFNLGHLGLVPMMFLSAVANLARLMRAEKFDLVQAHWAVPNTVISVFARALSGTKTKVFTSFPGSDVTVMTKSGLVGRVLARIVAQSDYLSCNSSDLKDAVVKTGIAADRVDYVIYGVNDEKISFSAQARERLRAKLNIGQDETVLLLVGRFVPKKGFSTAFRALPRILAGVKNVRLVVVGDGLERPDYLSILERDGTAGAVTFVGEIPTTELSSYYSACDIFVMPSRRLPADGLNVVVPEAMACERPVVATRVGGNDLVVFDGVNGFLHEEDDAEALADAVVKLAADPALRARMGKESLRLVKERFNWSAIARHNLAKREELAAAS